MYVYEMRRLGSGFLSISPGRSRNRKLFTPVIIIYMEEEDYKDTGNTMRTR